MQEPDIITSYSDRGRVSAISTRVAAAKAGGAESRSLIAFHLTAKHLADEATVRGAGCKIETMDESGALVTLQVDLHFFYPVRLSPVAESACCMGCLPQSACKWIWSCCIL